MMKGGYVTGENKWQLLSVLSPGREMDILTEVIEMTSRTPGKQISQGLGLT